MVNNGSIRFQLAPGNRRSQVANCAVHLTQITHAPGSWHCNRDFRHGLPVLLNCFDQTFRYYRHRPNLFGKRGRSARESSCANEGDVITMWKKHVKTWLLASLLFTGLNLPAEAQVFQPFGPVDISPDFDLFAPFVIDHFDPRPRPNEGFFFGYERVDWTITTPKKNEVGSETDYSNIIAGNGGAGLAVPLNAGLDLSVTDAEWAWGNRIETGYMVNDKGWYVGIIGGLDQPHRRGYGFDDNAFILVPFKDPSGYLRQFIDPDGNGFANDVDGDGVYGDDGIDTDADGMPDTAAPTDFDDLVGIIPTFEEVTIRNELKVSSVELMKSWRFEPLHDKSFFEFYFGARYLSIEDRFKFEGFGGSLDHTVLHGDAENHIVGPQMALRYESRRGRWKINADGRFMAGFNVQNLSTRGSVGSNVTSGGLNEPFYFQRTTYRTDKTDDRFSPVAELRLDAAYVVTKAIALKVGWTGTYVGRVARGSALIDYSLAEPGLLSNAEPIFMNGVNFGIEINR